MTIAGLAFCIALAGAVPAGAQQASQQPKVYTNPDQVPLQFPSDPQGAIRSARERIAAGDLGGAVKQLALYVAAHPDEYEPLRFLGDLYYRQGRLDRAASIYERILSVVPGDKETHNRLGSVYATQNRVDEAIVQFEKSLPGTDSVSDLVALHARKGDLPHYRAQMEALAEAQPTNADIQAEMGQVYTAMHRAIDALPFFMRALDSDPTSLPALNGLGLAYFDLRNFSEAEKNFKLCLKYDPGVYTCMNNLGASYLEAGDDASASPIIARAHEMAPERPESLVNFGFLADRRGDWKRAVSYYVEATVVGPYLPEAYVDLGIDYEHNGLYGLAEAALLKGSAAAPDDGRIRYLLAMAYAAQGNYSLALTQLKLAERSLDPDVASLAQAESKKLAPAATAVPQL